MRMVSLDKRDTEGHEQGESALGMQGQSATGPAEGPRADLEGTSSADTCVLALWPLNWEDVKVCCWRLLGSGLSLRAQEANTCALGVGGILPLTSGRLPDSLEETGRQEPACPGAGDDHTATLCCGPSAFLPLGNHLQ